MSKRIYRYILTVMVITCVLLCSLCYYVLRVADNADARTLAYKKLDEMSWGIDTKQKELDAFLSQTNNDNIAKAKAIALILSQSKEMFSTPEDLEGIRIAMDISELVITDKDGKAQNATTAFAQNDLSDAEKFSPFMGAVNSKSFSKAVNTIENNKIKQCIGVSRLDKDGLIYIETYSDNLSKVIELSGISTVCKNETVLGNGVAFILDKDNWTYQSHTEESNISEFCQYPEPLFNKTNGDKGFFTTTVQSRKMRVYYKKKDNYMLVVSIPFRSVFRISRFASISVGVCIVIASLIFILSVRKKLIDFKIE